MKLEKLDSKIVYADNTLTKRIIFNEDKVLSFVLNFRPGQGVPPHNHEESDLIIHVLTGEGELVVDGKEQKVVQGDMIHCYGKEIFSLKNTGDKDMSCLVILAPNPSMIYSQEV